MIVVDADGGDYAPHEVIKGALEATEDCEIDIALVGRKVVLEKLLRRYAKDREFTIIEASQSIGYDERPVQAIRNNPDSSIVVGTKLVRDGIASAFVSAGNTGAVLSAAFVILGKIEYIQRPALCGIIHVSAARPLLLIDAGANVDCQPSYLIGFAQLGAAFARGFLDTDSPTTNYIARSRNCYLTFPNFDFICIKCMARINWTMWVSEHRASGVCDCGEIVSLEYIPMNKLEEIGRR